MESNAIEALSLPKFPHLPIARLNPKTTKGDLRVESGRYVASADQAMRQQTNREVAKQDHLDSKAVPSD